MNERILLVEDDRSLRDLLQDELEAEGYQVEARTSAEDAQLCLKTYFPDLVISDLRLPGGDGLSLLPALECCQPRPAMLVITAFGSVAQAVAALKAGVDDFLTKPLALEHLVATVSRLLETRRLRSEVSRYRQLLAEDNFHGMVASGNAMLSLFDEIRRIATGDGPVLIVGESGTGKELVARAIHDESDRRDQPYITVNCGGIPGELMESEFFGHTSGAFTGAKNKRAGLFQQANGGTLLLDEVGELPLQLQAKLLRVLQDGEVRAVGSDRTSYVKLRVLAATNRDMRQAVEEGRFREDLYFRLETFTLEVPPLRERGEDRLQLANHFLNRFCVRRDRRLRGFSDAARECLTRYPFPGNVRELENAVERAVTFCEGDIILPQHLPARLQEDERSQRRAGRDVLQQLWQKNAPETLPSMETLQRRYAAYVLEQLGGNKRRTAEVLGITRRTLYRWLAD